METSWCPQWLKRPRIGPVLNVLRANLQNYGMFGIQPKTWPLLGNDQAGVSPSTETADELTVNLPGEYDESLRPLTTHVWHADFTQPRNSDANCMVPSDFAYGSLYASAGHLLDHTGALDTMRDLVEDRVTSCPTIGGWGSVADEEAWI